MYKVKYPDSEEFLKKLGQRIREIREEQNLSQSELGYKADLDKSYIQRLERGTINLTMKTLLKLSNALDLDVKTIF